MRRLEQMSGGRWLSVDEISAHLGVKRDTVYKWISEKSMPAHRMGRLWKFRRGEVDDWVERGGPAKWAPAPQRLVLNGPPESDSARETAHPVQKSMKLNEHDKKILDKFKNILQGEVKLHQVILFGSRARGDADPDSDMDVLVVVDGTVTHEMRNRISRCAWEAGLDEGVVLASVVYSREEWENGPEYFSPFAAALRSEGIPV